MNSVLFPPNRFEDGKFPWNGKVYEFPINEEARNNRLHGFVHDIPWEVEQYGTTENESYVTVSITVDEDHPVFRYLPFRFKITLHYSLSADGLCQHLKVHNNGMEQLPCLLAFHTAVNAPLLRKVRQAIIVCDLQSGTGGR